jgi:hypothetical protein
MRYVVFPGLVMLFCLCLPAAQSGQQSKKPETLAILASAKFVFGCAEVGLLHIDNSPE